MNAWGIWGGIGKEGLSVVGTLEGGGIWGKKGKSAPKIGIQATDYLYGEGGTQ